MNRNHITMQNMTLGRMELFAFFIIMLLTATASAAEPLKVWDYSALIEIKEELSIKSNINADEVSDKCIPASQTGIYMPSEFQSRLPKGKFTSVKIPGLKEQTVAAFASGRQYWRGLGPGFINVPMNIYVKGERILVQTDWGLSESTDGGENWRSIGYTLYGGIMWWNQQDFDVSPNDPNLIVCVGRMLYRTDDGGKIWTEIQRGLPKAIGPGTQKFNQFKQVRFNSDGSRVFACSSKETEPWYPMSKEQLFDTKVIFAGDARAESFQAINLKRPYASIIKLYPHPSNPDTVLFSFKDGDLFISRNARDAVPFFEQMPVPSGYAICSMAVRPDNPDEMLATLAPLTKMGNLSGKSADDVKPRLYEVKGLIAGILSFTEKPILDASGKLLINVDLAGTPISSGFLGFNSVAIDRKNPRRVMIGARCLLGGILISDDNCGSFRLTRLPKTYSIDSPNSYDWFQDVWSGNSPLTIFSSRMGAWLTRDGGNTLTPLFMTDDESGRWHGNKGVAASANICGISIAEDAVHLAFSDHRLWCSDGKDLSRWEEIAPVSKFSAELEKIRDFYFIPIHGMSGSPDGKYLYSSASPNYTDSRTRYLLKYSGTPGDWRNFTPDLGEGERLPKRADGWLITQDMIHFNSANSDEQWFILNSGRMLFTANGGVTFRDCDDKLVSKIKTNIQAIQISCIFFDAPRGVLYLGLCPINKPLRGVGLVPLYRSFDKGASFEPFEIGVNNIKSLTVAANGNLIVGTICDYELPGQLIVLEGADPAKKEVKCTAGDTIEEQCAGQILFSGISSDGNDVIALADSQGGISRKFPQGPLLSTDGGKTFRWIRYNLPGTSMMGAAIGHGIIVMEDAANNCVYKYKDSEFKVPGENEN